MRAFASTRQYLRLDHFAIVSLASRSHGNDHASGADCVVFVTVNRLRTVVVACGSVPKLGCVHIEGHSLHTGSTSPGSSPPPPTRLCQPDSKPTADTRHADGADHTRQCTLSTHVVAEHRTVVRTPTYLERRPRLARHQCRPMRLTLPTTAIDDTSALRQSAMRLH